jgi:hypothetical protein
MLRRLGLHRDDVPTRLCESFNVRVARLDHQVAVEGLVDMRAQRRDELRPEGDVRHEMSVHHVEVDPVGAGRRDVAHFLAELREVSRQNRGRDDYGRAHVQAPRSLQQLLAHLRRTQVRRAR